MLLGVLALVAAFALFGVAQKGYRNRRAGTIINAK